LQRAFAAALGQFVRAVLEQAACGLGRAQPVGRISALLMQHLWDLDGMPWLHDLLLCQT